MNISVARTPGTKTRLCDRFYGLNRRRTAVMGEAGDMINMSSDEFPCISPRGEREMISKLSVPILAVCPPMGESESLEGFSGIAGDVFYYNGVRKTTIRGCHKKSHEISLPTGCAWEIKAMGSTYIINGYNSAKKRSYLFYYNVATDIFGYGGNVMSNMILAFDHDYSNQFFIEALNDAGRVKNFSITLSDGTVMTTEAYLNLYPDSSNDLAETENIFSRFFKVGDEIRLEGFENNEQLFIFDEYDDPVHTPGAKVTEWFNSLDVDDMEDLKSVDDRKACHFYVKSIPSVGASSTSHRMYLSIKNKDGKDCEFNENLSNGVTTYWFLGGTISKKQPNMTKIGVHQGRIWTSTISGRELYTSASDDIFSFSASDRSLGYALRLPSETSGQFTALETYNNELIAMKDDSMNIVVGTNIKNYDFNVISGIGCIAPKSIVKTHKGLMFLSYDGFYLYNGAWPRRIGEKLNKKYVDAVCGFDGQKLYASARTADGEWELLVYDTLYGLWHKEDNFISNGFFRHKDGFYMCDTHSIYRCKRECGDYEWEFTLKDEHDFDYSGISEIYIRAEVEDGAEFTVETYLPENGRREHTTFKKPSGLGGVTHFRCPVRCALSNSSSIKLKGCGRVVIYSIMYVFADGGRRYKERM